MSLQEGSQGDSVWDASTGNQRFTGRGLAVPGTCHTGLHGEESSPSVFSQELQLPPEL